MKIQSVEYFTIEMPLAKPYTIAYETIDKAVNIILKITTNTGLTGWGCAAPDWEVTKETPEIVLNNFRNVVESLLLGEDPFQIVRFLETLKEKLPGNSSTKAAVDMALLDLTARKAKMPLYKLLGGYRQYIPTSVTIGIESLRKTLEQTDYYLKKGFNIIKIKGGLHLDEDVEKIIRMREKYGYDFKLRFDANQGYTVEQAIEFVKRTQNANIEIFEQPTEATNNNLLGKVTQNVDISVMADESIKTLKDAFKLGANELVDMINIKIMKVGGIMEAQHINSVACAAGNEVMVGCLDESALGISAGLHFALSRVNIEYADLDSYLELTEDPFKNLFKLKNGILYPNKSSGLGKIKL